MAKLEVRPNPANYGGSRSLSDIDTIIVHTTEGGTAKGAASWWARPIVAPGTNGSAHIVIDNVDYIRALPDSVVAYGAVGVNSRALHLELTGFVSWSRKDWLERHYKTLVAGATQVATWLQQYDIPRRWDSVPGIHGHGGLPGNDHTDPGPNFPWDVFKTLVEQGTYKPREREGGNTLRIVRGRPGERRYRRFSGWVDAEVSPGDDGPAGPVLEALARLNRIDYVPYVLAWQGGLWYANHAGRRNDRENIPSVARTILNRTR